MQIPCTPGNAQKLIDFLQSETAQIGEPQRQSQKTTVKQNQTMIRELQLIIDQSSQGTLTDDRVSLFGKIVKFVGKKQAGLLEKLDFSQSTNQVEDYATEQIKIQQTPELPAEPREQHVDEQTVLL